MRRVTFVYPADTEMVAVTEVQDVTASLTLIQSHSMDDNGAYVPPLSIRIWGPSGIRMIRDLCDELLEYAAETEEALSDGHR